MFLSKINFPQINSLKIAKKIKIRITLLGTDTRLRIMAQNPLIVMMPPWQRLPYREVAVLKIEYALSSNVS